jgi:hypothetical protein
MEEYLRQNYYLFKRKLYEITGTLQKGEPCFFPENEVLTDKKHLKFYAKKGVWLEYTSKLEFPTFEVWANQFTPAKIRFGYNRPDGHLSVSLEELSVPQPQAQPQQAQQAQQQDEEMNNLNYSFGRFTIIIQNSNVTIHN